MSDAYPLKPFRIHSIDTLCAIMRAYPLATLICGTAGAARMTLIPLLVEGAADQSFTLHAADGRIGKFIGGILGFRIRVTTISGIAKLAQDKGRADAGRARDYLAGLDNAGSGPLFDRLLAETLPD